MIALIAACAENRVIGGNNQLLWHIPEDLKHFKALTLGKPVIMGRKTFDSIGRPLPNRPNIVITRQQGWTAGGVTVAHSLEDALKTAQKLDAREIMIIGGAQLYAQALPFATRVYLTLIHKVYDGDALFPELIQSEWRQTDRKKGVECLTAGMDYEFITYERTT